MRARRAFLLAVAASVALVLTGPYIGELRGTIRDAFSASGPYVRFLNIVLAGLIAGPVIFALARTPNRRVTAMALSALSVIGVAVWWLSRSTNATQNAVERFHLVEYGFITWLFYRAVAAHARAGEDPRADLSLFILPTIYALIVSVADEWFQWFVPERVGEIADVILNGCAILAGLVFSLAFNPPRQFGWAWNQGSRRRIGATAAVLILAIAAFLQTVHVAVLVRDPNIGNFRSRYTAAELLVLSADRTARWKHTPPPMTIQRLSREDQYLTEASWHVQARNTAWADDINLAWRENQILETYFAPALDTASYVMAVSRWPPAQRADAERRAGPDSRPVDSHAERIQLFVWPPAWWTIPLGLAGLALTMRKAG